MKDMNVMPLIQPASFMPSIGEGGVAVEMVKADPVWFDRMGYMSEIIDKIDYTRGQRYLFGYHTPKDSDAACLWCIHVHSSTPRDVTVYQMTRNGELAVITSNCIGIYQYVQEENGAGYFALSRTLVPEISKRAFRSDEISTRLPVGQRHMRGTLRAPHVLRRAPQPYDYGRSS